METTILYESKVLKGGVYIENSMGDYYIVVKGATRSLDYSSDSSCLTLNPKPKP